MPGSSSEYSDKIVMMLMIVAHGGYLWRELSPSRLYHCGIPEERTAPAGLPGPRRCNECASLAPSVTAAVVATAPVGLAATTAGVMRLWSAIVLTATTVGLRSAVVLAAAVVLW